jgi:hypothetical protein
MPAQRPVALITGASAGLGAAFAPLFAAEGYDLVLVARRKAALAALARRMRRDHGIRATPLAMDLARPDAPRRVHDAVRSMRIEVLVNNAGVYEVGPFAAIAPERLDAMILLNCVALTGLTRLFLPKMQERGAGRILNVASVASFQAVPQLATYAATKAFVLSLSEALVEELRGTGVTVTALCPGITATEGVARARRTSSVVGAVPDLAVSDEAEVALHGFRACMAGEPVCVPGALNKVATSVNFVPRTVARWVGGAVIRRLASH